MQAKQKDGGRSFMCAQSSAWRTDSTCSESPSDFMTAGDHSEGVHVVPAVPKGFVRWVQLYHIDEPERRIVRLSAQCAFPAQCASKADRRVFYIYCGDGVTVPDTAGWEPLGEQMWQAMADKLGSQRILSLRPAASDLSKLSVERVLEENPVLVSAGVTLDDFSFTISSINRLASFPLKGGALKCCGCGRWHNVPDKVMHKVRCSLEVL